MSFMCRQKSREEVGDGERRRDWSRVAACVSMCLFTLAQKMHDQITLLLKIFTVDSRRLFLEQTERCSFLLDSFSYGRSRIKVLGLEIFDDFG